MLLNAQDFVSFYLACDIILEMMTWRIKASNHEDSLKFQKINFKKLHIKKTPWMFTQKKIRKLRYKWSEFSTINLMWTIKQKKSIFKTHILLAIYLHRLWHQSFSLISQEHKKKAMHKTRLNHFMHGDNRKVEL